jgi:hypothetical protein
MSLAVWLVDAIEAGPPLFEFAQTLIFPDPFGTHKVGQQCSSLCFERLEHQRLKLVGRASSRCLRECRLPVSLRR